ncbi:MAG: hypothetical protein HYZ72_13245 [Deltaproteobacteria bacterium]|nr:hypothetical protein [Deltaproteobacteria bacterium]
MNPHKAEPSTRTDVTEQIFSSPLLPAWLQGWVLLVIVMFMFIDGIRLLLQR